MDYVLIIILKYQTHNVAISQHTYNSQVSCEYAKAQTESLESNYVYINAICVKE